MAGGGGGSILAMIIQYRNNMKMLRKTVFNRRDKSFLGSDASAGKYRKTELEFKHASQEEILALRKKLKHESKRALIRNLLILTPFVALSIYMFFAIVRALELQKPGEQAEFYDEVGEKRSRYLHFVNEGYVWLEKKHWHNASWQFKTAAEILPDELPARLGIAKAMVYSAIENNMNSEQDYKPVLNYLSDLINDFPAHPGLYELRAQYYTFLGWNERAGSDYRMVDSLINVPGG